MFDLREVIRGDRDLDGACHRKRPVTIDADQFAAFEIERRDSDVTGRARDHEGKLTLERLEAGRRGGPGGLGNKGQQAKRE